MTTATAEVLYTHSVLCGSKEFTVRQQADSKKLYYCNKCQDFVADEQDATEHKAETTPETRKAA